MRPRLARGPLRRAANACALLPCAPLPLTRRRAPSRLLACSARRAALRPLACARVRRFARPPRAARRRAFPRAARRVFAASLPRAGPPAPFSGVAPVSERRSPPGRRVLRLGRPSGRADDGPGSGRLRRGAACARRGGFALRPAHSSPHRFRLLRETLRLRLASRAASLATRPFPCLARDTAASPCVSRASACPRALAAAFRRPLGLSSGAPHCARAGSRRRWRRARQ